MGKSAIKSEFSKLRESTSMTIDETAQFLMITNQEAKDMEAGKVTPSISNVMALEGIKISGIAKHNKDKVKSNPVEFLGKNNLKVFSFFSGAGFLDLGFERSGFDVEFVNENHEPFLHAYKHSRAKMGLRRPAFGYSTNSICEYEGDQNLRTLKEAVNVCKANMSIIGFIGGPPCPDFSVGGKNRGKEGDKGKLSKTYVNLICKVQPDFFLFENVKGLWRTKKHKAFFDELVNQLSSAGYSMKAEVLNSISFGAPQDRDRIILIGFKKSFLEMKKFAIEQFSWKKKYEPSEVFKLEWPNETKFSLNENLPIPNHLPLELTVQHWFEKNEVNKHPNAKHHFMPRAALKKFKIIPEGDTNKKSYKRVHRWRYSPTAAYGNNEVHLHPYKERRMSASEALAIQSLPKEFELPADMTLTNMFKTIGNGVPFEMAKSIADQMSYFLKSGVPK